MGLIKPLWLGLRVDRVHGCVGSYFSVVVWTNRTQASDDTSVSLTRDGIVCLGLRTRMMSYAAVFRLLTA